MLISVEFDSPVAHSSISMHFDFLDGQYFLICCSAALRCLHAQIFLQQSLKAPPAYDKRAKLQLQCAESVDATLS